MQPVRSSGIWSVWVAGAVVGDRYRYRVEGQDGHWVDKSDPVAAATCEPPSIDALIVDLTYEWNDDEWMATRQQRLAMDAPVSIYEVHLGSWGRILPADGRFPRYDEVADALADHALAHGFTHVELLPIMEHPFYGSWGYQTTGYFAPTARYGGPIELMHMIDRLHQRGDRRHPRLGAVALPHRSRTAWRPSTARTCTSTPTRARDSTPTGSRRSSTTGATRSGRS